MNRYKDRANSNGSKSSFGSSYATKVLLTVTAVSLLINYVETMVFQESQPSKLIGNDGNNCLMDNICISNCRSSCRAAVRKTRDIYGKKKIFLTVLLFYIAGVGLAGFASNIYMLIASRAIQGIGFAIVPLGLAIITDIFPKERWPLPKV